MPSKNFEIPNSFSGREVHIIGSRPRQGEKPEIRIFKRDKSELTLICQYHHTHEHAQKSFEGEKNLVTYEYAENIILLGRNSSQRECLFNMAKRAKKKKTLQH